MREGRGRGGLYGCRFWAQNRVGGRGANGEGGVMWVGWVGDYGCVVSGHRAKVGWEGVERWQEVWMG